MKTPNKYFIYNRTNKPVKLAIGDVVLPPNFNESEPFKVVSDNEAKVLAQPMSDFTSSKASTSLTSKSIIVDVTSLLEKATSDEQAAIRKQVNTDTIGFLIPKSLFPGFRNISRPFKTK